MAKMLPACFKAYDIRGKVPDELNPELARHIGRAFAAVFKPRKVAVGHDIRLSSPELTKALTNGLLDSGVDVFFLGLCGTEEIYHAAFILEDQGIDGGIVVTASHNPADYNGMKFVTRGARPVSGDSGLKRMAEMISEGKLPSLAVTPGVESFAENKNLYIQHLLSYVQIEELAPLKIVVNNGNGSAAPVVDLLERELPFSFVKAFHEPDGSFPHGVPNPLLPEKREETAKLVREHGADFGIAWDGDFDRCFFWDEKGDFIEGYYIVGLLALELLKNNPGGKILHDPRLIWNTEDLVTDAGGVPVMCKTGHAFIKERMRQEDAIYGGEMSAHHYFKNFGYCDSGMIPWLLVASLLSRKKVPLSSLVAERIAAYPVSGEINSVVDDPDAVIAEVEKQFAAGKKDYTDGLSVSFTDFRFNVRKSNTEPLLRLNVESRADPYLLQEKTEELLNIINA
ncbi:MAG TPA: phosphomannomutase [Desulfobacterales bacterium]|nr:phosphomannomutase [Desulfobacterales bacterium]HIP39582.1 phosphomannomutase [Desulfocapsa sulfexigens]